MSQFYRVEVGNFSLEFAYVKEVGQQFALNAIRLALNSALNSQSSSTFQPAIVVSKLLRNNSNTTLVEKCTASNSPTNTLRLTLETWTYKLYVYGAQGAMIWNGALNYFDATKDIKTVLPLSSYKDKVVRFEYAGGSNPKATRLVKVASVEDGHLKGTDLVKGEYRQFKEGLISKLVEVKI